MALKIGYLMMMCWVFYVVYSIQHMDAWNDDNRTAIALCIAFAGLVIFPVYFVSIYFFEKARKRLHR
ncbi:hypothetical protein PghCCS26_61970 [Paenibacillus glycanilyticus]|uniref:DUF3923 family protein n=1 Tax=Paenibacillus glycanilyticus TaxID=126569 RepID=A0ABQ6NY24_9BACL|nr:hypothetical protein [Paenibacillus glycanilyticus]GMK49067.1 hypothetical protein PghCCS26_61970 [Paenibacillus glycanilyticus]